MITKEEYESALILIEKYRQQHNSPLIKNNIIDYSKFLGLIPIKLNERLDVDDVIFLSKQDGGNYSESTYEKVICTGYCGRDEFWGKSFNGIDRYWCNGDVFKIVSKQINIDLHEKI